jgi:RNA polymerase sigma-70 factor (ECF subfamily)
LGWRGGNPASWLFAIARNLLIDEARRGRVAALAETADLVDVENAAIARTEIEETLLQLPESQRRLIRLVYIDGFTHGEVAAMTGSSAGAVKTAIWRARDAFKAAWLEATDD